MLSGIAIFSWIVWIACFSYIVLIGFTLFHWFHNKENVFYNSDSIRPCTILIPFRNEAENIPRLIDCLDSIKIDISNLEIILIDDHSEDNGADIIKSRQKSNFVLISSDSIGKKAAIAKGISIAKYNTIFQLDADGIFSHQWFYSVQKKLNSGVEFLTGIVSIKNPQDILQHFQLFDLMALMSMTNAGIQSKTWYMANGANMAYPKKLYSQISNRAHTAFASGDDMFLIEEASKQNLTIAFNKDKDGIVFTKPLDSFKSLIHQRLRWASKNKALNDMAIKFILLLVVLFNVSLLILPILDLYYFFLWPFKMVVDFILLKTLSKDFSTRINWAYFPLCFILYPFFIGIIAVLDLFQYKFNWKGRGSVSD